MGITYTKSPIKILRTIFLDGGELLSGTIYHGMVLKNGQKIVNFIPDGMDCGIGPPYISNEGWWTAENPMWRLLSPLEQLALVGE